MSINEMLRETATNKGLKQSYIAKATGLKEDTISKIFNNNRRILADEFLKLCEVLCVDPNEFRRNRQGKA